MAHRSFLDRLGRRWEAWDVNPTLAQRHSMRRLRDIRATRRIESRAALPADFLSGWLAFECGSERRRLMPIPEGWDTLNDEALSELLERAVVRATVRRLIE